MHRADGTFRPDSHGGKDNPVDEIRGDVVKPDLDPDASEMWDSVVSTLEPLGILATIDQFHLEAMCNQWSIYRKLSRWCRSQPDTIASTSRFEKVERRSRQALSSFESMARHYGLTPATRASLRKKTDAKPKAEADESSAGEFGIVG